MKKETIIKNYSIHENDKGSTQLQLALLESRIRKLTKHLIENKKDLHSRFGLYRLNTKKRKLLKYLLRTSPTTHKQVFLRIKNDKELILD